MTYPIQQSLMSARILWPAVVNAFYKLTPQNQIKNPVMFIVYIGSLFTTALAAQAYWGQGEAPPGFILAITLWLWFTVLFANFAEALAEGRSKAQAAALREAKQDVKAKKLLQTKRDARSEERRVGKEC